MQNSHASGAADQTSTNSSLLQKHINAFKTNRCDNCKPMRGDDFHPDRRVSQGDNIEGGHIQVTGTVAGSVR